MLNKVISTFGVKVIAALFAFIITIITARILGTEGRGVIGLFMATTTFVLMFCHLIGGPTLVYLSSRYPNNYLIWASYIWSLISNVAAFAFIYFFIPSQAPIAHFIFPAALLISLFQVNLNMVLGWEKIMKFNFLSLIQVSIHFIAVSFLFLVFKSKSTEAFFVSLYISYGLCFLGSLWFLRNTLSLKINNELFNAGKAAFRYGFPAQIANLGQLLNLRLSFYLLEYFTDIKNVGIFSTGTTLTEAVWLAAGSLATIQYSKIANLRDKDEAVSISIKMFRMSFIISLLGIIPLCILPENLYTFIFGAGFREIKTVILLLSPGIVAVGAGMAISHYFAGMGKYKINAFVSGIGVFATLITALIFIPTLGLAGAALATSISYSFITLLSVLIFLRESGTKAYLLLPTLKDAIKAKSLLLNSFFSRPVKTSESTG